MVLKSLLNLDVYKKLIPVGVVVLLIIFMYIAREKQRKSELVNLQLTIEISELKHRLNVIEIEKKAFKQALDLENERFIKENEKLSQTIAAIKHMSDSIKASKLSEYYKNR